MDPKHLATLELPKILERLARCAEFSASKELALALSPTPFLAEARQWQAETGEARRLLSLKPELGIGGARDVRPLLQQASLSAVLLPNDLLEIRQTLLAGRDLKRVILRLADQFPLLADIAERIHECTALTQEIARCIGTRGEVLDSASPDLARIRRELQAAHQRLLDKLNHIVHSPDNSQFIQEAIVTQRQGRYVIPLRAEFKGRIRGIVHDQSASGATLFVEPLVSVDLNNRWRQLQLDEEREVQRILAGLSQLVAAEADRIRWTVEAIAELDLAFAKARYAEQLDAVPVVWCEPDEGAATPARAAFKLLAARHPLLDARTVVPIDVVLGPETYILVITGPNTGGKTVALKTIGLLVAMAQAGLHIPAAPGSVLPFFRAIYADIGDEQSIEQSLSTFSSHLTNIVAILAECDDHSLVILDELGAGTDPVEGSALARAILEELRTRGVMTCVATHYPELKSYAHHTPGVINASVEFDADTLAPTYRLKIGLPGRSNAFAIAQRLGLAAQIVEAAQALVPLDVRQSEAMLRDIQAQLQAATEERMAAAAVRAQAEARLAELNQRLAQLDRERRDILNAARAEARRLIKTTRQELEELRARWTSQLAQAAQTLSVRQLEADSRAALDALETQASEEVAAPPAPGSAYRGPLHPGDIVWVVPLQASGEVISSRRGEIEVQVGRFRTRVRRNQVELRQRPAPKEAGVAPGEVPSQEAGFTLPVVESPGLELDLRGQTADEGLHALQRFLDDAYLAGLPWVRIIHGKGSGILRAAVRDALKDHPLVTSYQPGADNEGGEGVTIARLASG